MAADYSNNKESCNVFSSDTLSNLTDGFLNVLQPEAVRVEKSLQELTLVPYNNVFIYFLYFYL